MLGRDGVRYFVNIATGWSRERVESAFPEADPRGSIPWALVESEVGPDAIVGGVTIRREVERLLAEAGYPVGPERARQLVRGHMFGDWRGVDYTLCNRLSARVGEVLRERAEGIARRTG
jgi:hypothetical protein